MKDNRFLYTVKFIACLAVIVIHTRFPGKGGQLLDALARFAVPFFFALSGRYLLETGADSPELTSAGEIRSRVKVRLLKLLKQTAIVYLIYLLYSFVYHLFTGVSSAEWFSSKFNLTELKWFLLFNSGKVIYDGSYTFDHMWYLFALIYVYALIIIFAPMLRKWYKALVVILMLFLYFGEGLQLYYPIRPFGINISTWYVMRNWLFVGMPFVLIGIVFADYVAKLKKERSSEEYTRIVRLWKMPGICLLSIGILSTCFESLILGKVEVYIGSFIIVIALLLMSEAFAENGKYLLIVGKSSSSNIYFYHVLIIAIIDLLANNMIIPQIGMLYKPFIIMAVSILLFFGVPTACRCISSRK